MVPANNAESTFFEYFRHFFEYFRLFEHCGTPFNPNKLPTPRPFRMLRMRMGGNDEVWTKLVCAHWNVETYPMGRRTSNKNGGTYFRIV